jgi:hypothetical protein
MGNHQSGPGREIRARGLAARLWQLALDGDLAAIKYLCDRLEGMPRHLVAHAGDSQPVVSRTITAVLPCASE